MNCSTLVPSVQLTATKPTRGKGRFFYAHTDRRTRSRRIKRVECIKGINHMIKAELLKKLKAILYRSYGKRCRQFNISCAICSVWMAYDILEDHLLFDIDTWLKPKKWYQFWK